MLMQAENYRDGKFIAEIEPFANLEIGYSNIIFDYAWPALRRSVQEAQ